MTPGRFARLSQALNGVGRKVLEAVPIQAPWTIQQINAELYRSGTRMDLSTLEGCLDRLRRIKLITEPTQGSFVRVQIRVSDAPDPDDSEDEDTVPAQPAQPAEPADSPLTKLAQLAAQLHSLAKTLEDVALEIQAELEREQGKTAKLRQLQAALKELV